MIIHRLFLIGLFAVSGTLVVGQKRQIDPSNVREGENVEYCIQHKKLAELKQNPLFLQTLQQDELIRAHEAQNGIVPKGVIYKIPVVFHILHDNGSENISDEQVLDALRILNRDYRKLNPDTLTIHADFDGLDNTTGLPSTTEARATDVEFEFVLATKAPNGTCFNGITRTVSALTNDGSDGTAQVDAIIAGNNVYQGQWPGNKYMNIYICAEIGGAAGYTYKPSSWGGTSMYTGIWILHNYLGSIGTSTEYTSRALTHEVGHWFNLSHTWGDNNNPGNASSCASNASYDGIADTPATIGSTSCNKNLNSCATDNAYWGFDIRDNVENYMDYSYCSKMFTGGQVNVMRQAITSSVGGRNNLWTTSNLSATGTNSAPSLCKADFEATKTDLCVGETVTFNDASYNAVSGWTWSVSPATGWAYAAGSSATTQNPEVTFSVPGFYQISLTATDGSSSDAEVKAAYIRVMNTPSSTPFLEGFESYSSLSNLTNWMVYNQNANNTFAINSSLGQSSSKSVSLTNFGQPAGSVDELISGPVDLSSITGSVTLSFRYAYRKRATGDYEYLKVLLSKDCGNTWVQRKTLGGNSLSTLTSSSSWSPSSASDWTTVHMTNVTSDFWIDNFRYKFRFESDGGNNLFLDNINIYQGAPSDSPVLSLDENQLINGVSVYPNPADEEVQISFYTTTSQVTEVSVLDVSGKILATYPIQAMEGSNLVLINTSSLTAGMYLIRLSNNSQQIVQQLVIE